jgi:hypothetical protein
LVAPTAVHDVALKQLIPNRVLSPDGFGTVACAHEDPFQVKTMPCSTFSSTPAAAQKLSPAQETEAISSASDELGKLVAVHEDPFHW